jgi:uncharacterized protein
VKFLLLFFIFMVLLWQWRQARQPKVKQAARKNAGTDNVQEMVACADCGVHLPASDAVPGAKGLYCSTAHRQAREP